MMDYFEVYASRWMTKDKAFQNSYKQMNDKGCSAFEICIDKSIIEDKIL